jgi:hypothetical protein
MEAIVKSLPFAALLTALALTAGVPDAAAQGRVVGQVTDASTRQPLASVLMTLLDADGAVANRALTSLEGRYVLAVPRAGTWRVTAEFIGYHTAESPALTVERGDVTLDLRLEFSPLRIDAVVVDADADARCGPLQGTQGAVLARMWEEARKALNVVAFVDAEPRYRFVLQSHRRTTDIFSGQTDETRRRVRTNTSTSYRSRPVEDLLEHGWVRASGAATDYFAPDAAVVVSDAFQAAYCFRLAEHPDRPDWIGLGFEPARRGARPEIEGVLWLERDGAAPRRLDFSYTDHVLAPAIPAALLPFFGGEIIFSRTDDGVWIVQDWALRMPQYVRASVSALPRGARVPDPVPPFRQAAAQAPEEWRRTAFGAGFVVVEVGGVVAEMGPAGDLFAAAGPPRPAIEGVIRDSTRAAPLAGALVVVRDTATMSAIDTTAVTDAAGAFRVELSRPAAVHVTFTHARLDTLGVEVAEGLVATAAGGETAIVELAIPSLLTIARLLCRADEDATAGGLLRGVVRDTATGEPVAGAAVRARDAAGGTWRTETTTGAYGEFMLCDVPGRSIVLDARILDVSSVERTVYVVADSVMSIDLGLPLDATARVVGIVRTAGDGTPVHGAEVRLTGMAQQSALSDRDGGFTFNRVPVGTWQISARHPELGTAAGGLEVGTAGSTSRVELRVHPSPIAIEPIVVTAEQSGPGVLAPVYDRVRRQQLLGLGQFLDRDAIEEQAGASRITSLIGRMPGISLRHVAGGGPADYELHSRIGCPMLIFVDGRRIYPPRLPGGPLELIDDYLRPDEVELIEVYRRASQLPAEFTGTESGCGAVAIWTRRR